VADHLRQGAHERLRVADALVARDAARVVGAVLGALMIVLAQIPLRGHGLLLLCENWRDVQERGRHEPAQLELVRLEQQQLWGSDRREGAGDAGAAGQLPGALDGA
jgi:hypothetical protein